MYITTEDVDGIQFLSGKTVEKTNLKKIIISYSKNITKGYRTQKVAFDQLHKLTNLNGHHWVNHKLRDGYRDDEHCIPGANIVVLDVENSVNLDTAKYLLNDYAWLIHTTKRHTEKEHRFRILIPLTHHVELNAKDFKQFMQNVYNWLPFEVDDQTGQRSRKWLTCKGNYWYNEGQSLDTLQFIPKTKKADEHRQRLSTQTNLSHIERWFINESEAGNRNNKMRDFGFMLIDAGYDGDTIRSKVLDLNSKIKDPLDEAEILSTIMVSVTKRLHTKE
jgi:hypothetical protein